MGKTITYILMGILSTLAVYSANYDFIYNPYTAKLDRSLKLNQSGNDIIANKFYGGWNGKAIEQNQTEFKCVEVLK